MNQRLITLVLMSSLAVVVTAYAGLRFTSWGDRWLGEVQYLPVELPASTLAIPAERTMAWREDNAWAQALRQDWALRPLEAWDARRRGAGWAARSVLARLWEGHEVAEANAFLLAARPWGRSGSSWALHRRGDYDFILLQLTAILWLFGERPEVLYPATRDHLLQVLLTEEGGAYRAKVPRSLGLVTETENHLLMTEGARYLKNRWLAAHGSTAPHHDNLAQGLEARLLGLLAQLRREGLYEFNSQPYIAYTLSALLNLEAFAAPPVREEARALLDELNWAYAVGSLHRRHFPPFRRRVENAGLTSLTIGYQTAFFAAWDSFAPDAPPPPTVHRSWSAHALFAAVLPYRPPDAVMRLSHDKGDGYLVHLGHGPMSSPEIYAAGPGYLLSAGGVHRGARSLLVARPTVLLLDDDVTELAAVFHLAGPGENWRGWNNTGVHRDFAVAAGPVHVPPGAVVREEREGWRHYRGPGDLGIVVYAGDGYSVLALVPGAGEQGLLDRVLAANPAPAELAGRFRFPDGREVGYDPWAPPHLGVMTSADGQALDRDFDRWPRRAAWFPDAAKEIRS